jgi:uncharacterized radical SAM protein YgiQ
MMFLPTTKRELHKLGWDHLDVILITGDSYIDSPHIGVAVIGKVLLKAGYRVGIVGQPDVHSGKDITRLGEPRLFWGVTGGSMDSLVANYTATKKKRRSDDYTPGGINDRRPDRAVIAYSNLIKRYFKETRPIVLGGLEASLRRIAQYDYWSDCVRRSVLFDAKADLLVYGMGEKATLEIARRIKKGNSTDNVRGVCRICKEKVPGYIELPSYEEVARQKPAFAKMFRLFYDNNDPLTARGLCQRQDTRYLIQNPPAPYLTQKELDAVYDLDYERDAHSYYKRQGKVKALETIRFSIATHRGCYGECNFCAIGVHEGRAVRGRSEKSILNEAGRITRLPGFKGNLHDVGGPTANMYGFECQRRLVKGNCPKKRCMYPRICRQLKPDHSHQIRLLQRLRGVRGIKRVFVASGIRHDLVLADRVHGGPYLRDVVRHHVSGQMKVAPEHTEDHVLDLMGKPGGQSLLEFREMFFRLTKAARKKQFLTYYLIAAHPGCTEQDMRKLSAFVSRELKINPEQVQVFTPLPSTYSSVMYYTQMSPFTGEPVFVQKRLSGKERQKNLVTGRKVR